MLAHAGAIFALVVAAGGACAAEPAPTGAPAAPALPVAPAVAAGAVDVRIELTNGDQFRGVILEDADPVVIQHAIVGRMAVPRATIKSITAITPMNSASPPAPSPVPAPTPVPVPRPPEATITVDVTSPPQPALPPVPPLAPQSAQAPAPEPGWLESWKFTFEGGWNGSSGNTNQQSVRVRLSGVRAVTETTTNASIGWNHQQVDGEDRANNVIVDMRNEWNPGPKGGWGFYVAGNSEYNEFTAWDFRVSANAGLSFDLLKDNDLTIVARTGFGGTREFGSSMTDPRAEFWPSLDVSYTIDERSKLGTSISSAVNVEDVDASRADIKAWYEVIIDPEHAISLKIGIEDRYEYAPAIGRESNQLEYYAALVIPF